MRRAIAFLVVLLVGVAGLYFSQRRHDPTPVSANAVVAMAADAQRDLTRAPMRLTRLSDDEEIAVGKELAEEYAILPRNYLPKSTLSMVTSGGLEARSASTPTGVCPIRFISSPTAR